MYRRTLDRPWTFRETIDSTIPESQSDGPEYLTHIYCIFALAASKSYIFVLSPRKKKGRKGKKNVIPATMRQNR
ncbi:hypothetical protein LY78DRAFT_653223 [Colletotrichum sublineola]|nr:hypothetical protein LY78DRAFT_653223 [Colletotrichum sublineola]